MDAIYRILSVNLFIGSIFVRFTGISLRNKYGDNRLPDNASPIIAGGGIGVKIPLGPILFRVDTAWDINPNGYSRPQYYISIGTDW